MMTKQQMAFSLDKREYGEEMTELLEQEAKDSGLVVVYGYSDDNIEFRGSINDEIGAFDGAEIMINKQGILLECECECDCLKCTSLPIDTGRLINAMWDVQGYSWVIETDIPHETFDILEDGEKFCKGIVFNLSDI